MRCALWQALLVVLMLMPVWAWLKREAAAGVAVVLGGGAAAAAAAAAANSAGF